MWLRAVAITFGDRAFGSLSWIVPIGVACSTFGAANGSAFTAARLSYAAAKNGHFPKFISYLSQSRLTPLMAVIFNCTLWYGYKNHMYRLYCIPDSIAWPMQHVTCPFIQSRQRSICISELFW